MDSAQHRSDKPKVAELKKEASRALKQLNGNLIGKAIGMAERLESRIVVWRCPKCKREGFRSIYPDENGRFQCTDCANLMRFGKEYMKKYIRDWEVKSDG